MLYYPLTFIGLLSGTTAFFYCKTDWWFLPLFLIGGYAVVHLLFAFILFTWTACLPKITETKKPSHFYMSLIHWFSHWLMHLCFIRVKTEGLEKLPEGSYVMICNHQSNLDPLILTSQAFGERMLFISKPENYKIPMIGPGMVRAGFLPINRQNPRSALVTLQKMASLQVKYGYPVCIYPEGTRSRTGKVGRYKDGAVFCAKESHTPIAVFSLDGAYDLMKHLFIFHKVTLKCLAVIPAEECETRRMQDIMAECREMTMKELGQTD